MIGSFFLKSQTTQLPACDDARMCCTCRFHAIHATSCAGCSTPIHTSSASSRHQSTSHYTPLLITIVITIINKTGVSVSHCCKSLCFKTANIKIYLQIQCTEASYHFHASQRLVINVEAPTSHFDLLPVVIPLTFWSRLITTVCNDS